MNDRFETSFISSKKLSNPSKLLIHHPNLRVQPEFFSQRSKENSSIHEWSRVTYSFILFKKLSNASKLLIQISESNHSSANDLNRMLLSTNDRLKLSTVSYLKIVESFLLIFSKPLHKLLIHRSNLRAQPEFFSQRSKENSSIQEWSQTTHSYIQNIVESFLYTS